MTGEAEEKNPKKKIPTSKVLRDRIGGPPPEALEYSKKTSKVRREIISALKEGPKTVPEVAKSTGLPTHEVLWHVMSLRAYGKVVEGDEEDGYLKYSLKQEGWDK